MVFKKNISPRCSIRSSKSKKTSSGAKNIRFLGNIGATSPATRAKMTHKTSGFKKGSGSRKNKSRNPGFGKVFPCFIRCFFFMVQKTSGVMLGGCFGCLTSGFEVKNDFKPRPHRMFGCKLHNALKVGSMFKRMLQRMFIRM